MVFYNKKLSYRRETAVQGGSVVAKMVGVNGQEAQMSVTAAVIPVNCGNSTLEREGLLSPQNLR